MKIPTYKKLFSYLFDIHIESRASAFNPVLDVFLAKGRFQLCTANAIYSFEDLYDNYRRAFEQIEIRQRPWQKVLVLGLGLGSIPMMLEKRFEARFAYTLVEIDEEVVYLASKYALNRLSSSVETVVADAHDFMIQNKEKFDLICMDVFVDDIIPSKFQSEPFLKALSEAVKPDGLILYNRLARTKKDLELTTAFYENHFRGQFPQATRLDVNGNWMLLNRSAETV